MSGAGVNSTASSDNLPFAFDVAPDQIAYMSCSDTGNSVNKRAFFSFRVGAYSPLTSGLKFSEAFRALHPDAAQNPTRMINTAIDSPTSAYAQLQLSVRERKDYQSVLFDTSSAAPVDGESFASMLPSLDNEIVLYDLASALEGTRVQYFPLLEGLDNRLLEGTLAFMSTEAVAAQLRTKFLNDAFLTLTYTDSREPGAYTARGPSEENKTSAYGVGFGLGFGDGFVPTTVNMAGSPSVGNVQFISSGGQNRVFWIDREVDLLTGKSRGTDWECSTKYQFMIVRAGDEGTAAAPNCRKLYDDVDAETVRGDVYRVVRNVLPSSDWWIDWANRCAIPKTGGCYAERNPKPVINYGKTKDPAGMACGPGHANGECPHFVSICVRR